MQKTFDRKSIILVVIIVLTGTASFGLGRLSIQEEYKDQKNQQAQVIVPTLETLKIDTSHFQYVASKNGTKYYPIGCKSALRIKEENRIYFADVKEAENSGLSLTSTCN
jgi:flagellar basal body-associated protein FliL